MIITLIIISAVIITTYVLGFCLKYKSIPSSISASFYTIEHKIWFGVAILITSVTLLPAILELTPENYKFLAFLACSGMIVVGSAPNFREDLEGKIHTVGAILCLGCSQILVGIINPWLLLFWIPVIIFIIAGTISEYEDVNDLYKSFISTNPLFWIEINSLLTTYLTTLLLAE